MLPRVLSGAERRSTSFLAFVTGTFFFGWVAGFVVVFKLWQLGRAARWMMLSGIGYVTFMLVPAMIGFGIAWLSGRLVARGWGGTPLRLLAVGVCGLLAGLLAL
jgi:hypothetical protein